MSHGVPNVPGANSPLAYIGMEVTLMHLIAGGVCERFPSLKFVPTEFETGWIGNFLRRTDHTWTRHGGKLAGYTQVEEMGNIDAWEYEYKIKIIAKSPTI